MTKTKKKELKKRLFKILNIVSYILSGLMIIILIVCIVQGCSNTGKKRLNNSSEVISQPNNAYLDNSISIYVAQLSDSVISLGDQSALSNGTLDVSENHDSQLSPYDYVWYDVNVNGAALYYIDVSYGEYKSVSKLIAHYISYTQSGYYVYRLDGIMVETAPNDYTYLIKRTSENPFSNNYAKYSGYLQTRGVVGFTIDSEPLSKYLVAYETNDFVFNKQFNYNAPMGISIDSPYGSGASWTQSTSDMAHIDFNVGWFISNGQLFDTIQYWCISTTSSSFEITSSSSTTNITQGPFGQWAYVFMYYENSETQDVVTANYRNQKAYTTSGGAYSYYYQNSSTWQNDEYRYVYFLNELDSDMSSRINAFNNNNQYNGGIYNGGDNVFTLIGSAFTGLMPLLSTMILPNITIGMLLLIPLVVMLVFAIIKIIKK